MASNESTPLNKGAVSALDKECLKASSPEPLVQMENSFTELSLKKIVSEYDQEIPQSQPQTTPWHREEEPLNHHETPGRQIKQINQLSLPHQDDCNTRMNMSIGKNRRPVLVLVPKS